MGFFVLNVLQRVIRAYWRLQGCYRPFYAGGNSHPAATPPCSMCSSWASMEPVDWLWESWKIVRYEWSKVHMVFFVLNVLQRVIRAYWRLQGCCRPFYAGGNSHPAATPPCSMCSSWASMEPVDWLWESWKDRSCPCCRGWRGDRLL